LPEDIIHHKKTNNKMMLFKHAILLTLFNINIASCFTSRLVSKSDIIKGNPTLFATNAEEATDVEVKSSTDTLSVPLNYNEMVNQVSKAVNDAKGEAGINRQIIRILLPRDSANADLGIFTESDASSADSMTETILVPPDDTWQGGIMQLYRAASPTCEDILKKTFVSASGLPPKLTEDRSVDESGVDGVSLLTAKDGDNDAGVSCFVQPMQETIDMVENIATKEENEVILMVNPQWRSVDDALDTVSNNEGFLGNLASFLGGKGNSLRRLNDLEFQSVYVIEGYVCKGGNIKLMKRFDSDWVVFAEKDDDMGYVRVGTSVDRPTYQDVDKMMDEMGISLKYARDIGLAPKL